MEHFPLLLSRYQICHIENTSCQLLSIEVWLTVVNSTTKGGHELHQLSEEKVLFETAEKTFHYKYSFLAAWPA